MGDARGSGDGPPCCASGLRLTRGLARGTCDRDAARGGSDGPCVTDAACAVGEGPWDIDAARGGAVGPCDARGVGEDPTGPPPAPALLAPPSEMSLHGMHLERGLCGAGMFVC